MAKASRSDLVSVLVGRWEPIEKSAGGVSAVLEILKDGTFVSGVAVQVDLTYSLEGKKLSVMFHNKVLVDGVDVEFEGERMIISGEPIRMRVGPTESGGSPIVGVWTYEHHTGAPAYERYGTDGTVELRIPMPGESRGRWMFADGKLTMDTGDSVKVSACEIDGDVLTIRSNSSGGSSRTLRRTAPWYAYPLADGDVEKLRARVLRR